MQDVANGAGAAAARGRAERRAGRTGAAGRRPRRPSCRRPGNGWPGPGRSSAAGWSWSSRTPPPTGWPGCAPRCPRPGPSLDEPAGERRGRAAGAGPRAGRARRPARPVPGDRPRRLPGRAAGPGPGSARSTRWPPTCRARCGSPAASAARLAWEIESGIYYVAAAAMHELAGRPGRGRAGGASRARRRPGQRAHRGPGPDGHRRAAAHRAGRRRRAARRAGRRAGARPTTAPQAARTARARGRPPTRVRVRSRCAPGCRTGSSRWSRAASARS